MIVKRLLPLHCPLSNLLELKLGGEAAGRVFNGSTDEGGREAAVTEMKGLVEDNLS